MKFIADVMLGKLARWLRLMGYDTAYDSSISDEDLMHKAHQEDRIILTMDHALAEQSPQGLALLIKSQNLEDQLQQVVKHFKLDPYSNLFERCTICNTPVVEIAKSEIKEEISPYVYSSYNQFWRCPTCKRLYWEGSHLDQAKKFLEKIFKEDK